MSDTATYTILYSYVQAWAEAARLQKQGYVTRVWYGDCGWHVRGITLAEWEAKQNDGNQG